MDGFTIRVTPEELAGIAERITAQAGRVKEAYGEMQRKMRETAGCWTGDAADIHRAAFEEHTPDLEALVNRFSDQADRLKQISANYSGTQIEVLNTVENLPVDVVK